MRKCKHEEDGFITYPNSEKRVEKKGGTADFFLTTSFNQTSQSINDFKSNSKEKFTDFHDLQASLTAVISFVFSSCIINEFEEP